MLNIDNSNSEHISIRQVFHYLKPIFLRTYKGILLVAFCIFISGALGLLPPYLGKQVFDKGIMAKDSGMIVYYCLLTLGIYVVASVMRFGSQVLFSRVSNKFSVILKSRILNRIIKLPLEFFDRQRSGYIASRIGEADSVTTIFSPIIFQIISGVIEAIGAFIIVTNISSTISMIMLPFIPLFIIVTTWMNKKIRRNTNVLRETSATTAGGLQEILSGIYEIKQYDLKGNKLSQTIEQYKDLATKSIKQSILVAGGTGFLGLLTNIFNVSIMIFIGIQITQGQLTVGDYVALTGYSLKIFNPIQSFGSISLILQPVIASMKRIGLFFESETEQDLWGNHKSRSLKGSIAFTNVSFTYNSNSDYVLDNCNFKINAGESIALFGKNGSGKSTILKLILGMYHSYTGQIAIDGILLRQYDVESLRSRIGIVSQNTFLFKGSLLDNITISFPEVDKTKLDEILEISGCTRIFGESIDRFQVEEYGKNLSGGQKQAAAIARCLLKNPDILLFDEATTHLDNITKRIILNAFQHTFNDKTRILITHDNEIAKIPDRILLLNDGYLTELQLSESV